MKVESGEIFSLEAKSETLAMGSREWCVVDSNQFIVPPNLETFNLSCTGKTIVVHTDSDKLTTFPEYCMEYADADHVYGEIIYLTKEQPCILKQDGACQLAKQKRDVRAQLAFDPVRRRVIVGGMDRHGSLCGIVKGLSSWGCELEERLAIHGAFIGSDKGAVVVISTHYQKAKSLDALLAGDSGFEIFTDDWGYLVRDDQGLWSVVGIEENILIDQNCSYMTENCPHCLSGELFGNKVLVGKSRVNVNVPLIGFVMVRPTNEEGVRKMPQQEIDLLPWFVKVHNPHTPFHNDARWELSEVFDYYEAGVSSVNEILGARNTLWNDVMSKYADNIMLSDAYNNHLLMTNIESLLSR